MRRAVFLIATAVSIVPHAASAQVSITSPAAGAASSYRTTVVSWDPIPGASSYHLELDDDLNFGSPEVDVIVADTSYRLSDERLNLNGQTESPVYVRINGVRWNAGTLAPTHFKGGYGPALAVDSQNRVYLGFATTGPIHVTTSNDWSHTTAISLDGTLYPERPDLASDESGIVHAFWRGEGGTAFYANSGTGWNLVPLPGPAGAGCAEPSIAAGDGQIDLFHAACWNVIQRWTSTDGVQFTPGQLPNNDVPTSVSAGRDAVGNLYVASERFTTAFEDLHSSVQTSADGWISHRMGPGRYPSLAVTPNGELHVLRWGSDDEFDPVLGRPMFYSNSLRGFETWIELPVRAWSLYQDILPLVLDGTRHQLHTAFPSADGLQFCSTSTIGMPADIGTSWSCSVVANSGTYPDVAVAPDGTIHVAWEGDGVGYANSLGSFVATNFAPQVSLGMPSHTPSAVIVSAAIADADGDHLAGHIRIGRYESVTSHVAPGSTGSILMGKYRLTNPDNNYIYDPDGRVQFYAVGGWRLDPTLYRGRIPPLPVIVQVSSPGLPPLGVFVIEAWDDTGVTISQIDFLPHVALTYDGTLPGTLDISALPEGEFVLAIVAWDGATPVQRLQAFTKASGQDQLLLTPAEAP